MLGVVITITSAIAGAAIARVSYLRGHEDGAATAVAVLLDLGAPITRAHVDELRRRIGA